MFKKLLLLLTVVVVNFSWAYESQDDEAATLVAGMGVMVVFAFLVFWIVVSIFFILSQNKLIDAFAEANQNEPISKVWTWTQLIPLWSIVALIVSIIKLSEQNELFIQQYGTPQKSYSSKLGWAYVASWLISMIISFVGIIALILWIVYWVNISGATKSVASKKDSSSGTES